MRQMLNPSRLSGKQVHCKCSYPRQFVHFLSGKQARMPPYLTQPGEGLFFAVCCTLQTANRCLLDSVGVDPTPAGRVDR